MRNTYDTTTVYSKKELFCLMNFSSKTDYIGEMHAYFDGLNPILSCLFRFFRETNAVHTTSILLLDSQHCCTI